MLADKAMDEVDPSGTHNIAAYIDTKPAFGGRGLPNAGGKRHDDPHPRTPQVGTSSATRWLQMRGVFATGIPQHVVAHGVARRRGALSIFMPRLRTLG